MIPDIKFEDYEKMVWNQAWYWHKRLPNSDVEDLFSEGKLAFYQAKEMYNPNKGSFSTLLYFRLNYKIEDFALHQKSRRSIQPVAEFDETISSSGKYIDQEKAYQFKETLDQLSKEAKEITDLIFNTPGELIDMALQGTRKITLSLISVYLKQQGWKSVQIEKGFSDIKKALL